MEAVFESDNLFYTNISKEYVDDYLIMFDDLETLRGVSKKLTGPPTMEEELEFIQKKIDDKALIFTIFEKDTNKFVGNIEIKDIKNKKGELGICLTKDMQNKHYGTEAIKRILKYAFEEVKLDSMHLNVYPYNKRAIRCYQNIGFIKTGEGKDPGDIRMKIKKN